MGDICSSRHIIKMIIPYDLGLINILMPSVVLTWLALFFKVMIASQRYLLQLVLQAFSYNNRVTYSSY